MKKTGLFLIFGIIATMMTACSSTPEKTTTEAKPAVQSTYESGREGLQKMYIAARNWAIDSKPYRLQSQATKDANGQDGKSGIWQAGFASPSKGQLKLFSWSGLRGDDAPEPGINSRPADTYNPANTSTQIFDVAFLKKDSNDAFEVAQKRGGDKLIAQKTDMQVFYELQWNGRKNQLVWRVLYDSANDPKLAVDVDASTGEFLKVER